jgi:hypothetical protein
MHIRQQSLDVNVAQGETGPAAKTARKQCEKPEQFLAESGNLLPRHLDGPPWFTFPKPRTRRIVSFASEANAKLLHQPDLIVLALKKVALSK